MGKSVVILLALLLAVGPGKASAGRQTASQAARRIEGTVIDNAGKPVPGAVVLIEDLKSLQVRSFIVQADGKYRFHGLSADANYELRARFNDMASGRKTVSVFDSSPTIVVDLKLTLKTKRPAGHSS